MILAFRNEKKYIKLHITPEIMNISTQIKSFYYLKFQEKQSVKDVANLHIFFFIKFILNIILYK